MVMFLSNIQVPSTVSPFQLKSRCSLLKLGTYEQLTLERWPGIIASLSSGLSLHVTLQISVKLDMLASESAARKLHDILRAGGLIRRCQLVMSEASSGRLLLGFRKWYYNAAGFNKLGLMRDDTISEDADVHEALRRLPETVYNDRMFRIKRALDLNMRQQILPKSQWTKYEQDVNYLEPYLKEVIRERKEREEWQKK
ncbi:cytochrome b-c1 complex subunit 7 isoform X1 [Conger conger]|uniref:cytochrome b-c1 complex subunit 7 isoform X1 n=1 Tax=Conger conger TaxID=82655 RepID=UPI002A5A2992|nr:cytochrome b-c1 complex subunit 7 isoform X1 [Conger conger]